ncbi:MAG: DNA repair protein RecO [Treponema sp.]|jgi:DNA repair protein RecO (recombination protein O)|nr:DNA repair protein RecO [Treponema sp.]
MQRTAAYSALVLHSRPAGESNREVYLLTGEEGIIKATVFGGPKSKLRAHASPFNSGKVWVYRNPVKDSVKITDFDIRCWRPGLRELYDRSMTAAAITDTVLATRGSGGSWDTALNLTASSLDALENANEELCPRLLIHFLWQWLSLSGLQPRLETCAACGKAAADSPLWLDIREGDALCANCAPKEPSVLLRIGPGSRRWLDTAGRLEPARLYRYTMDGKSRHEAKSLVCALLNAALGKKLASWEW